MLLFLLPTVGFSQKKDVDTTEIEKDDVIEKIESIAEQTDAELDYTDLLENLDYYVKNPINLNNTNSDELRKLIFLNEIQITNLLAHIEKNGKLISINELQSVSGFDPETINKLLPYVYVSSKTSTRHFSFKEMFANSKNQLLMRYSQILEEQKGFSPITDSALNESPNSRYLGSPQKLYAKYRFTYYNNISFGITGEKDAGEVLAFRKDSLSQKVGSPKFLHKYNGFDFTSAHLCIRDFGVIKALAIGDYQAQFGQGLTLWTGLGFGKSGDATGIKKNGQGISPFTSVNENLFMRGIATTVGIKKIELSLFYSNKKIDANISSLDSTDSEVLYISSLQQTGLHSIPSEIADKDAIGETAYGGHIAYKAKKLNIGATAFKSEYSASLQRQFQLYNQFIFNGKENSNIGFDYSYVYKNINLFGEVSQSANNARAFLTGALLSLDQKVTLAVMYRNYDKKYQGLYSAAFAEGSSMANEKGIFFNILLKPSSAFTINAYMDNISFPWMRFRVNSPSKALDYLVQMNWIPSKKMAMYVRYRQTEKSLNSSDADDIIDFTTGTLKQNYRYNASFKVSSTITLKNRIDIIRYKIGEGSVNKGYLIYQDVVYKKIKSPLSFSFRYALFDADSYDSRLYAYETDVLYASSIPALYNKGIRYYLTAKYTLSRNIDFWLRFAQTSYSNVNSTGTGLTEIEGNTRSEVKVQMRIKF
ncbi:MAG: helix-hairpin-helix domain-containing protein [Bacteroidetes bacterium]|nr:helix-hairpin-helix domain-containing protein [Bacteroidota bacterium]